MNASRKRNTRYTGAELPLPTRAAPPPPPDADAPPDAGPVQMYTLAQAARRLAISRRSMDRLVERKKVRTVRIGHQQRIAESELRRVSMEGAEL